MSDRDIQVERAQNLWTSFRRRHDPLGRAAEITPDPRLDFDQIGGLEAPKEEILTYACAATNAEVYGHWGTQPPSGMLLIGAVGSGKKLLARALATRTHTSFVRVDVPRLVLDVIHASGKVGELIAGWSQVLEEMPPVTVLFDELEFSRAREIGARRGDLPVGPVMDFLLELVDRTIAADDHLVVGATSHPDSLRPAFVQPGRFERLVEVTPTFPDDVVQALQIHAAAAEKRAGRPLFAEIDWRSAVGQSRSMSIGDWVHVLHAVLRRKARCEAAGEQVTPVTTDDFRAEVRRFEHVQHRVHVSEGGQYL
jgi:ATP-dependent 26S proteasome regulatory subunit